VLRWVLERFQPGIALACSFGAEDVALVDMVSQIDRSTKVFYLDTEALFPETYELVERVAERYDIQPLRAAPAVSAADQARLFGDELWKTQPDLCCAIRKVQPLTTMLRPLSAWITGIRRQQTPSRASAGIVEWDGEFGLVKVNPLARWTSADVWKYIAENEVPYNPLHDRGYPSLGCTHCTRPVKPGEDPRAGRWADSDKIECGLHQQAAGP
jgi:phosphoadenosine phosphosulfate reductase